MIVRPSLRGGLTRPALGCLLVAGSLLAGTLSPHEVHAAFSSCRSDPIVWLSNGATIDLTATFANVERHDVRQIVYVLHVPQGVYMTRVVYTAGELGHKESLSVVDDGASAAYLADTVSDTADVNVTVTVTMTVHTNGHWQNEASGPDHTHITTLVQTDDTASRGNW